MPGPAYHVVPDGTDSAVTLQGSVVTHSPRRAEAIEAGRRLAEANQPNKVVVRGFGGQIEEEWTPGIDTEAGAR